MFGMSFTELVIIAILALILLGPDKLPDAARSAGKLMRELRRATDDIRDQLETEIYTDELKKRPAPVAPVPAAPAQQLPGAAASATPGDAERPAELPPPYAGLYGVDKAPAIEPAPAPAPPEGSGQGTKA